MTTQATTHVSSNVRPSLLRLALRADAIFCLALGAISLVAAQPLAAMLGIPALALDIMGAIVAVYGAFLLYTAAQAQVGRRIALAALVLDVIWVIDSAVLLIAGWLPLTNAGMWTVGIVALAVVALAELKFFGLRRLR
ncbi:MAG TPA: hypothetical protein VFU22_01115 [Roseiflexaceae bacterium]|nr:hypothetical protein [Roseiflexaceae bacterium]